MPLFCPLTLSRRCSQCSLMPSPASIFPSSWASAVPNIQTQVPTLLMQSHLPPLRVFCMIQIKYCPGLGFTHRPSSPQTPPNCKLLLSP